MTTYLYHQDPGHGWLQVPLAEIDALGIADELSGYSYKDEDNAYLEEDCDLALFLKALTVTKCETPASCTRKAYVEGVHLKAVRTNEDAFTRGLKPFKQRS